MTMVPRAETDVIGRHGVVGVDVLSHDPQVVDASLQASVDELFARLDRPRSGERASMSVPAVRKGVIAVADTVSRPETTPTGNYL